MTKFESDLPGGGSMSGRTVTEADKLARAFGPGPRVGEDRGLLRILFLVSAHNGLSQRAWVALRERGHEVAVAVVDSAAAMQVAVSEHDPELIVCPFL